MNEDEIEDQGSEHIDENDANLAMSSLALLALNEDNHKAIIDGNGIKSAVERIIQVAQHGYTPGLQIMSSIDLLVHLFAFGSNNTKQLIQNSLSPEILDQLKDNQYIGNEIQKLINAYSNSQAAKELIKIRRLNEMNK
ncbi:MAG: hypothetical protein EZS28_015185 [Streblomastix strix]|uniref:Uncharacterized protein n=1 Tax=Streblomastix strix TaxID=222440 RepID=A0A5J4W379_9EUKA|nr:MAG: hypothetical protein EZS28_015185 [Streblomastix strix]